jgi:hypothetical protein
VGITERAVQKIVRDLQDASYLTVTKQGRCNRYRINKRKSLRHGLESHCTVGKLLTVIAKPVRAGGGKKAVAPEITPGAVDASAEVEDKNTETEGREAEIEHKPQSRPAASEKKVKKEKKEKKETAVDIRQQRSLF